ncbi:MAG: methyltransferase domain-containing protein [Candidatus Rariloculaceae bacterium]
MSQADRDKWEKRYREGSYGTRTHPSEFLVEWLPRLPKGRALDVACGIGRNALYLAEAGYAVDAIDISSVALQRLQDSVQARGLTINCTEVDLESGPLPDETYDLIVLVRYTSASLIARLLPLLREGGCFACEEHLVTTEDVIGPSSPGFRVAPGELRELTAELEVLSYSEGLVEDPDGRIAALASIVAKRA